MSEPLLRFLMAGDPHVGGYAERAGHPTPGEIKRTQRWLTRDLADLRLAAPESEFMVMLGDLTENGSAEELRAYAEVVRGSPIPVRNVFGGHDGKNSLRAGEQDRLSLYRDIIGPPWWVTDHRGVRFIALVSERAYLTNAQKQEQETWLRSLLDETAPEQPLVLLQHTAPTDERIASCARHNLKAVLYGHHHCTKVYRRDGVLVAAAPAPNTAGFNGEPRGALEVGLGETDSTCRVVPLPPPCRQSALSPCRTASPATPKEDWPDFHGGTALRRRTEPFSGPLEIAWSADAGGTLLYNSPVVAGGSVYLATGNDSTGDSALICFDGSTGAIQWRTALPFPACHTPAISPSGVLVLTTDGTLGCFDATDGRSLWSYEEDAGPERWAFHGPATTGDTVFLRAASSPPVSTNSAIPTHVVALNAADGTVRWKQEITHTDWMCTAGIPLCVDGHAIVPAVLGQGVSCFDQDSGRLVWDTAGLGELARAAAPPGYDPHRRLVLATGYWKHPVPLDRRRTGSVCALRMADGSVAWRQELSERLNAAPVAAGDTVLVADPGKGSLVGLDADTGAESWRFATGPPLACTAPGRRDVPSVSSTPAVAGRTAYFGAGDGYLYGVDVPTGTQIMRCHLGASIASSPALSGNALYVGACDGRLYALTPKDARLANPALGGV